MAASATVTQLLARWAHLYGHAPVSTTVTYFHFVGILVGGGVAVAADRASLRLSPATTGARSSTALPPFTVGWLAAWPSFSRSACSWPWPRSTALGPR